ncbi:hypothetical protein KP509_12G016100 [Ceratopteris richardii]|uniref:Ribulose bisphosphate carboxylase small subunit, chloroplastic n=1 Tax=Ceratopteris richardii TaxID=49495 RepID=A0A8T2TPW7_CERRI|nr:hypothetical protein KP509_12G016100 [Ceratopteris richardii]
MALHLQTAFTSGLVVDSASWKSLDASFTSCGLNPLKMVSNGTRVHCMKVVNPETNRKFETLSYVPALSGSQIAKQIDYIIRKGWIPCLEFDHKAKVSKENSKQSGYYDGRYWTLWKLPMFGCVDASVVLREIEECKKTHPDAYIRLLAFDNTRNAQSTSFLIHRPSSS